MSILNSAPTAFTFDDFTLMPVHSTIASRRAPDVSTYLCSHHRMDVPIISAPMNTVTGEDMAITMANKGANSVLHRYMTIIEQQRLFSRLKMAINHAHLLPWVAIGASGDFLERAEKLYFSGARRFVVDVANGHSKICVDAVKRMVNDLPRDVLIMAGNVCSYEGAYNLANAGADVIRVGIGPGAACKTRQVTGHGIPQLSALEDCLKIKKDNFWHRNDVSVVADGGIRSSGDIVKALAIGADAVMIGGLLAGTRKTPGSILTDEEGNRYKEYSGMASEEGRKDWFSRKNTSFVPEGESFRVPYVGETESVIDKLTGGLRVGMSFCNANNLKELTKNAVWVRITDSGRREGNPNSKMFRE